jgi:competence protein ComEC
MGSVSFYKFFLGIPQFRLFKLTDVGDGGSAMSSPIVPLLTALVLGISCSSLFPIPDFPIQVCLLAAMLMTFLGLIKKRGHLIRFALLMGLFTLGILQMNLSLYPHLANEHIINFLGEEKITIEGVVCDNPLVSPEKTEMIISTSRILVNGQYRLVSGRLLLNIREPYPFRYGDVIRFQSKLRLPHNFNNPGGFDYERHLRFRGILVRGFVNDGRGIVVLRRDMGNPLWSRLERFRELIRHTILHSASGAEGAIIQAMILGDQKEIPKEVMDKFNRTGTTHIIAISGFNIGIVALFSLFVVRLFLKSFEYLLLRWDITRISTLFAILVIILYTFIAGLGISVIRASIMVVLFMIAILINRERDLYNTLALAAFCILIMTPYALFDVSFQLSFMAVVSLLFLTPKLTALLPPPPLTNISVLTGREALVRHVKSVLRTVIIFFFASFSATLGTLPLILFYFNRLSLVTLAANFIIVPILGIIAIPFCLFIVLAVPVSTQLADIIIEISAQLVKISLSLVDWFAALPWSSVYVTTPTLLEIVSFYLLLGSMGYWLDQWIDRRSVPPQKKLHCWKIIPVCLILFFILNGIQLYLRSIQHGILSLTAIDVGQGSAILIRFPGGKKMLVDGGGFFDDTFDVGKLVIAPFLWHEKIDRIDTVVLTHPHPDHLQGLLFILDNFHVHEVWTNGQKMDSPLYRSFRQIIQDRGITMRVLSDMNPNSETSGVTIRILNPPLYSVITPYAGTFSPIQADYESTEREEYPFLPNMIRKRSLDLNEINNRSLVIKLSFGRRSFLLPGDISEISEWRLSRSEADLRSDVLFVPHHGSVRSSTIPFIEQVNPQVAVISCGFKNVFGVPHAEVLGRYERMQSLVFRTDRDGAVTIVTDGNDLKTSVFRSNLP